MALIFFTNWLWIPFILYYNIRLYRDMKARSKQERDASWPRDGIGSSDLGSGPIAGSTYQRTHVDTGTVL